MKNVSVPAKGRKPAGEIDLLGIQVKDNEIKKRVRIEGLKIFIHL